MIDIMDFAGRVENTLARLSSGPRIDVRPQRPLVSFTFDDVPQTALTTGARVLEASGARGTFYIAGGLAGRSMDGQQFISPDGIAELHRRGHEIGDHTYAHVPLRQRGRQTLAHDFDRNAQFLGNLVPDFAPRNMAFPYNRSGLAAPAELRRRFRSARGGRRGINRDHTLAYHLNAVEIAPHVEEAALTGWIDDVATRPGWLIFFTHDVSVAPSPYGTTPEMLGRLVEHALGHDCTILSVDAALDQLDSAGQGSG